MTKRGPAPSQPCGTKSAYARHIRNGEPACEPCRQAIRDYHRQRRAQTARIRVTTTPDVVDTAANYAVASGLPLDDVYTAALAAGIASLNKRLRNTRKPDSV